MSDENFRRELNQVFDNVAGSPSPELPGRVRSAVATAPEARGSYWVAGVAAVVIAILLVGVLVVGGPFRRGLQSPAGITHATPTPASAEPFLCQLQESSSNPPTGRTPLVADVSSIRIESKPGYDELTIEFANGFPSDVNINPLASGTTFTLSPSGQLATLKGQLGILITIHGGDLHTAYSGPTDIVTGGPTFAEVRRVQDFEGVVQLGLGVNGAGCYRASWLTGPDRLVIDVQSSQS
jgi:hypothetical protein